MALVAGAAADHGRDAESRAMMAAWQVRPPRFVTMAEARFITGSQSGSVMFGHQDVARAHPCISFTSLMMRAFPAPMRCPMLRPAHDQASSAPSG